MQKRLEEALLLVSKLPQETLDAIAYICNEEEHDGDYFFDGEGSTWEESVAVTLDNLANRFRNLKKTFDPESIHN